MKTKDEKSLDVDPPALGMSKTKSSVGKKEPLKAKKDEMEPPALSMSKRKSSAGKNINTMDVAEPPALSMSKTKSSAGSKKPNATEQAGVPKFEQVPSSGRDSDHRNDMKVPSVSVSGLCASPHEKQGAKPKDT